MRFHVPDQGNGSMIIVEKNKSPILFFDLGQSKYGDTTFKSYYSRYLGYIANNDHISINEAERPLDIIISHLHSDHFRNLSSDFLDILLQETKISLRSIWAPPVDLLFAANSNQDIMSDNSRILPLEYINSDLSSFYTRLHEFTSDEEKDTSVNVKNHFIDTHRDNTVLGEEFKVEWLAPPSTSANDAKRGIRENNLKNITLYSPVSDADGFLRNVNENRMDKPSTYPLPLLTSITPAYPRRATQ